MKRNESRFHPETFSHESRQYKLCAVCGRKITWRRKWRRDWDNVKYCSQNCRRSGLRPIDRQLEETILRLLQNQPRGGSICLGEAARRAIPAGANETWRDLMEPARSAARRLAAANRVVFLQAGIPVDPSRAKGPVRLKIR